MISANKTLPARARARFRRDVLNYLARTPKELPCKYFYDERGSELFEEICQLDDYYPTRTELAILEKHSPEIASCIGSRCCLIELGSGSSRKTRLLLDELSESVVYVPIDISGEHLLRSAKELEQRYPTLDVLPVCADFTEPLCLPELRPADRRVVFFPGSTIGNFDPPASLQLLRRIHRLCGPAGGLVIGIDFKKDMAVLERAYNDGRGVTRLFNLNLLVRINRELEADFPIEQFEHRAVYNAALGRIEMHLISLQPQCVRIGDKLFRFEAGETIRSECSYKYTVAEFRDLAARAGFVLHRSWTDDNAYFGVLYFTPS